MTTFAINAQWDDTWLRQRFNTFGPAMARGAVNTINRTLLLVQAEEREHVEDIFTVRNKPFIRREAAKIDPFASVKDARPFGEIAVGQRDRLFLSTFEAGGVRPPAKGKHVAFPQEGTHARPSFAQPVAPAYRFTSLRFTKTRPNAAGSRRKRSRATVTPLFGALHTYLVPDVGVFQREPGQKRSTRLYTFIDAPHLPAELGFVALGTRIANVWLERYMADEVLQFERRQARGS